MYNVTEYGAITAIRIFSKVPYGLPMAELTFAYGGSSVIDWSNTEERKEFETGINAYTLFYDERISNIPFSNFQKETNNYLNHIGEWVAFYSPNMNQIWHGKLLSSENSQYVIKKRNGEVRTVENKLMLGICRKPTKTNPNPTYIKL